MRLRSHLIGLVLATLLPVLGFATIVILWNAKLQRDAVERGTRETARALAIAVDRELGIFSAKLEVLATSAYLEAGNLEKFQQRAAAALKRDGTWIMLADPSGRQLVNTLRPFGTPLPLRGDLGTLDEVVRTGKPAVSSLSIGAAVNRPIITVDVPVVRDGRVRYVLSMSVLPEALNGILLEQQLPPDWLASIVDRNGIIIARTRAADRLVGKSATSQFVENSRKFSEGFFKNTAADGQDVYAAFSRSPLSGWTVGLGAPAEHVEAPLRRSLWALGAGVLGSALIAVALAAILGKRIVAPVVLMARTADALGRGETPEVPPFSTVTEVNDLGHALTEAGVLLQQREAALRLEIAHRQQAEEHVGHLNTDLRHQVRDFQTLFDVAPIGIAVAHDPECRRITVNPAFARLLGVPEGANVSAAAPPDERVPYRVCRDGREVPGTAMPMEVAAATGTLVSNAEAEVVRADGTRFRLWGHAAPLFDERGRVRGSLAAFMDITERTRIEDAQRFLAEASMKLAASLDHEATLASVARLALAELADWCVMDLAEPNQEFRRVAVAHKNRAKEPLARLLRERYAPDPNRPHPISQVLHTGHAELVPDITDAWLEARARDAAHLQLLRDMGLVSAMLIPLMARGRLLGVLSLASAESGRRYGSADLALAEELARRAAAAIDNARLYREAHEAAREAREAVRARETFLARASHELRTPLTSALGTVRLLTRAMAGSFKARPEELVDIANRNLSAMLALINDLLDASKLASGREMLAREPVELAAVVRASLEVVGAQARDKGVGLRVEVPARLQLSADRLKLEQVLTNLLANAVKFTPAEGEVTVSAERGTTAVVLRVRDTGEGIARGHLEAIFEPFFQAGDQGSRVSPERRVQALRGTGLGLAICRQIVTLHGGRIWAESEGRGHGSTFTVWLPVAAVKGESAA